MRSALHPTPHKLTALDEDPEYIACLLRGDQRDDFSEGCVRDPARPPRDGKRRMGDLVEVDHLGRVGKRGWDVVRRFPYIDAGEDPCFGRCDRRGGTEPVRHHDAFARKAGRGGVEGIGDHRPNQRVIEALECDERSQPQDPFCRLAHEAHPLIDPATFQSMQEFGCDRPGEPSI